MYRFFIIVFFLPVLVSQGQVRFRTVVPQQPVIAGESFQVQYVLEGADGRAIIVPPVFRGFRLISGPNIYTGEIHSAAGDLPVRNYVYTLEAPRPGRYVIPGTEIRTDPVSIRSEDARVEVVLPQDISPSFNKKGELIDNDYYLRPGEDPYRKIRENLFLKVQVDRTTCRVGEPVLATFKLYSRLESRTDIEKNPGFYGFSVYDMVGLPDKQVASEKVNGRLFDVHTIRKVQLYPLRAGRFTIDPMEVRNRVEFSRSAVSRKTEQEIAEGMMGIREESPRAEGTDVYETVAATEPVTLEVKPLPEKARPDNYAGAVGQFSIGAEIPLRSWARNEQGVLEITISGAGNFMQLGAPEIHWPDGVEGFEPRVQDKLDKTRSPLAGSRIFRFPFLCTVPGRYQINPVRFSFFDTDSSIFRVISTGATSFEITNEEARKDVIAPPGASYAEKNEQAARRAGLIAMAVILIIVLYWVLRRKEEPLIKPAEAEPKKQIRVAEYLEPVTTIAETDDKSFYSALQSAIWNWAGARFGLSGSEMNKQVLAARMNDRQQDPDLSRAILDVLEKCEAGIYTNVQMGDDRQALLLQVQMVMERLETGLL